MLNGGSTGSLRAPDVPGLGPTFDWGLADFDIRNVFHFSGGYELPFGENKKFLANSGKLGNDVVGGWSVNWISAFKAASPLLQLRTGTTAGTNCNDMMVPGQSRSLACIKMQTEG